MEDEFLTLQEFASKIFYSERYVRQMCVDGKIHAKKITDGARKWLIPASELERLKAGSKLGREANLKPYVETSHKQKMRELAGRLRNEISLPGVLSSFIFEPGQILYGGSGGYGLRAIIDEKWEVLVECTIERDKQISRHYQRLLRHLETGGLSEILQKSSEWKKGVGQYLKKCHDFLMAAIAEKKKRAKILDDDIEMNTKVGYKTSFFISACADAIEIAKGNPPVTESGYHCQLLTNNLWLAMRYGSGGIYVAKTRLEAKRCCRKHRALASTLSDEPLAGDIAKLREKLEQMMEEIKQQLQDFIDRDELPGHCDFCLPVENVPI